MSLRRYLDDSADSDEYRLRLAAAGYEVVSPRDVDMVGAEDGAHLAYATRLGLAVLTKDTQDFGALHDAGVTHAAIIAIYNDNANPGYESAGSGASYFEARRLWPSYRW